MFEIRPYRRNNNPSTYNPFREMEDFEKRFFQDPFGSFFEMQDLAEFKTDVTDEGDSYLLEADLPGFTTGAAENEPPHRICGGELEIRRHS